MPKERIGALIGKGGNTKRLFEERTSTLVKINSETGDIVVSPVGETTELLPVAKDILRAIACGFSGSSALELMDEDKRLEVLDLKEAVGKSYQEIERVKSHIIGRNGKVRTNIEAYTSSRISVYESSVGIICDIGNIGVVRRAIEMLIKGSTHIGVYNFLEEERRKAKEDISLWEDKGDVGRKVQGDQPG